MNLLDKIMCDKDMWIIHISDMWIRRTKFDPMVIPTIGCASFHDRGNPCKGSNEIDKEKYCYRCKSYNKMLS